MVGSVHRQRIGAELRRIREDAGLSGEDVASALGWSQSKVSRVETARFAISIADLAELLDHYGVAEEVRAELLAGIADDANVPGAWVVRAGGPPRRQREVAAVESRVTQMRQYHPIVVPGQLQSRSYARQLADAAGYPDPDEVASRRVGRQKLLDGPDAPEYLAVLDTRCLMRWAGSRTIIVDQVEHLLARAQQPSISVRVLTPGGKASALALAPFLIYDFKVRTSPSVVLLEAHGTDLYLSAQQDVATYAELFDLLLADTISSSESLRYLRSLVEEMKENPKLVPGGRRT